MSISQEWAVGHLLACHCPAYQSPSPQEILGPPSHSHPHSTDDSQGLSCKYQEPLQPRGYAVEGICQESDPSQKKKWAVWYVNPYTTSYLLAILLVATFILLFDFYDQNAEVCEHISALVQNPLPGTYHVKGHLEKLSYDAAPGNVWWCGPCCTLWVPSPNSLSIFSSNFDSSATDNGHCCDAKKDIWYQGVIRVLQDDSYLDVTILGPGDCIRKWCLELLEAQRAQKAPRGSGSYESF